MLDMRLAIDVAYRGAYGAFQMGDRRGLNIPGFRLVAAMRRKRKTSGVTGGRRICIAERGRDAAARDPSMLLPQRGFIRWLWRSV